MSETGGFFAIDRRCIERSCRQPDGLNLGCAHLVLARFASGKNHATTRAGMTAIHGRLGLSRGRADAALRGLEIAGIVSAPGRGGTRKLSSWADLEARGAGLSDRQAEVLARVKSRAAPILSAADPDYQAAYALSKKKVLVLTEAPAGKPKFALPEPDYLFLPNALVDGFSAEDEPLGRLRQIGDVRALETLIRVYQHANLPEDGGVPVALIRQRFNRAEVGRRGHHTIWAFAYAAQTGSWDPFVTPFMKGHRKGPEGDALLRGFWRIWDALRDARLVEYAAHVFEGEAPGAQTLHAFPVSGGTAQERMVFDAARAAAYGMVSEAQIERAVGLLETSHVFLCPVPSHVLGVQLVGIARPVYRANTSKTRAWAVNFLHRCEDHARIFKELSEIRTAAEG